MVQLNDVPATLLLKAMLVGVVLHIVVAPADDTLGVGFTVTTMLTGDPAHPLAVGVTI
jgi:hypothetical protein